MFIKRVQEKQGALKRFSLLTQPLLPPPSPFFRETHIVLRMSNVRPVPRPPLGQRPLTGCMRQNVALITFSQLTAAEWLGQQVRTLSENTHRRDNGELLPGPLLAVHNVFSFCWSADDSSFSRSLSQQRVRRSEKLFYFFVLFCFGFFCLWLSSKTGYMWIGLLLAELTG